VPRRVSRTVSAANSRNWLVAELYNQVQLIATISPSSTRQPTSSEDRDPSLAYSPTLIVAIDAHRHDAPAAQAKHYSNIIYDVYESSSLDSTSAIHPAQLHLMTQAYTGQGRPSTSNLLYFCFQSWCGKVQKCFAFVCLAPASVLTLSLFSWSKCDWMDGPMGIMRQCLSRRSTRQGKGKEAAKDADSARREQVGERKGREEVENHSIAEETRSSSTIYLSLFGFYPCFVLYLL
jgi:hypothetical protein